MFKTELDDLADAGREMVRTICPMVGSDPAEPQLNLDQGEDAVEGALGLILLYCRSAEVNFEAALARARGFARWCWEDDMEMQNGTGGGGKH